MSKFDVPVVKDKATGFLRDVTLCYVKIQVAAPKYKNPTFHEYTVDVVVDEDTADAWVEAGFDERSVKSFKNTIFTEKYKIDPPLPNEKKQWVIKLKAPAEYQNGDPVPYAYQTRPKVLVPVEGGNEDVTMDLLVSNGSKGDVSFRIRQYDDGVIVRLTGALVKDLIEYESDSGGSAFGTVVNANEATAKADAKAATNKKADDSQAEDSKEEAPAASAKKAPVDDGVDGGFDDSIPF